MTTAHINNEIGPLVTRQVTLQFEISKLADQLNAAIGHENSINQVEPLRTSLREKREELAQTKNRLVQLRTNLLSVYERELVRLQALSAIQKSREDVSLERELPVAIEKLKKQIHG